ESSGAFYAGEHGAVRTGFAIVNPGTSAAQVRFELTDMLGNPVTPAVSRSIPANTQMSLFLDQLEGFQNLPASFQGLLRVSTNAGASISIIGLRGRYNERGDFLISTAEPTSESANPATELYFPHFVQSGGYTTQFVLYPGIGSGESGTMRFFTQLGEPMDL